MVLNKDEKLLLMTDARAFLAKAIMAVDPSMSIEGCQAVIGVKKSETLRLMTDAGWGSESAKPPKRAIKQSSLSIEERELAFRDEVASFKAEYPAEMLERFFSYWREPSRDGKKMKMELQKTWSTKLRLITWARNNRRYEANRRISHTERVDKQFQRGIADISAAMQEVNPSNTK